MNASDLPLRHVWCLTPSKNGIESLTRRCIDSVCELGAGRLELTGCADVALARNLLMTKALESAPAEVTVFLLVDDDMSFSRAQAELVVGECLERERPVSAIYATNSAAMAHTRRSDGTWLSGLGFMAVQRAHLVRMAEALGTVSAINGNAIHPFCQSAARAHAWFSEDYWFCDLMGGVDLLPMAVAHLKKIPLTADAHTIDRVLSGALDVPEEKEDSNGETKNSS